MVYPVSCTAVCYVTVITPFFKTVGVVRPNFGVRTPRPPQWLRPWCSSYNQRETISPLVFVTTATAIHKLRNELHTLTEVPRSNQPSTLRGTVKWLSAFGTSNNNKWWTVDVDGSSLTADSQAQLADLVWGLALSLHSTDDPGELSQWLAMITAP